MKICVAGQGAFGQKHLDALKRIQGVEVTSLVGGNQDSTAAVAKKYGVPHYTGAAAPLLEERDNGNGSDGVRRQSSESASRPEDGIADHARKRPRKKSAR